MGPLSKKTRRLSQTLTIVCVVGVITVFMWTLLTELNQVVKTQVNSWEVDQTADCAVVLTGGAGRVREGVDLLAAHSIRKLIVSGVHPSAEWREIFPMWPFYQDISEADIVLERRSLTTFGNAQQSAVLAEALECKDLLVVTSVYHLHRALSVFKAELKDRMPVKGRAVPMAIGDVAWWEVSLEAIKSVFYSFWAY